MSSMPEPTATMRDHALAGRFWPMHRVLYENHSALAPDDLRWYAQRVALDVERFAAELRQGAHLRKVEHDFEAGGRAAHPRLA